MTALENLCDILQTELGLSYDQVYIYNQKIKIPEDDRLYVAVGINSVKPFSAIRSYSGPTAPDVGFLETQAVNMMADVSIDILSRGPVARDRKEEVILALQSTYAAKVQQTNAMLIAKITSGFVNLSEIDGSAIPYRFSVSVVMQYLYTKTKQVEYYSVFEDAEILTEP